MELSVGLGFAGRPLRRIVNASVVVAAICILGVASAHAQADFGALFGGGGRPAPRYRVSWWSDDYDDTAPSGSSGDVSLQRMGLGGSIRLFRTETSNFGLNLRARRLAVGTDLLLPVEGTAIPGEWWRYDLSLAYSNKFDNGDRVMLSLGAGVASDDPFEIAEDTKHSLIFGYQNKVDEDRSWLFFLVSGNYVEELNYIPLPGFAYMKSGEKYDAVLGMPFAALTLWPNGRPTGMPMNAWMINAFYFPTTNIRLKATRWLKYGFRTYFGYEWRHDNYLLSQRFDEEDRFGNYEMRLSAGISGYLSRSISWDISGGYSFERVMFEGENFFHRGDDGIELDDALVLLRQVYDDG